VKEKLQHYEPVTPPGLPVRAEADGRRTVGRLVDGVVKHVSTTLDAVQCPSCHAVIISRYRHDFHACTC
jgi:hypothetical protein